MKKTTLKFDMACVKAFHGTPRNSQVEWDVECQALATPALARQLHLEHLLFHSERIPVKGRRAAGTPATLRNVRPGFKRIDLDLELSAGMATMSPRGVKLKLILSLTKVHKFFAQRTKSGLSLTMSLQSVRDSDGSAILAYLLTAGQAKGTLEIKLNADQILIGEIPEKKKAAKAAAKGKKATTKEPSQKTLLDIPAKGPVQ